jgi:hypothetical protein
MVNELYRQRGARHTVRKFMTRPIVDGHPQNTQTPILVFDGARGSGKTAFLDGLADGLARTVPFARFDFESDPHATVDDVLTVIAFDLGRWRPIYGSLDFQRFAIGQLVKRHEIDLTSQASARQQVIALLTKYRRVDLLRAVIEEAATEILSRVPVVAPVSTLGKYMVQFVLDKLVSWVGGRRVVLGRCQHWYGTRDVQGDSVAALVDLNRWAHNTDDGSRKQVGELLWAAFLADIRDSFRRGRRSGEWSLNCVLLLDNVDTPLGRSFLAELVRARTGHLANGNDDADPLTVVATSRGGVRADPGLAGRALADAADADPPPLWLVSGLDRLQDADVDAMVRGLRLSDGDTRLLARRVHAFTCGHPDSTRLLLEAVAERRTAQVELAEVLDRPVPGALPQTSTVEERLRANLLAGVPEDDVANLITMSAARDKDQALLLATRSSLLHGARRPLMLMPEPDLWANGSASTEPLRRLLLRRLAAREPGHPADWSTVHGSLRRFNRQGDTRDETGELYHALADADVTFVVTRLAERLGEQDTQDWLTVLDEVTAAPRRPDGSPPHEQVEQYVGQVADPLGSLARVVVGLWIAADPTTTGKQHLLHFGIATAYNDIARLAKSPAPILSQAYQHAEAAKEWH